MFGFLGKVKDAVASNVNKIKSEVTDFLEENKKLEEKAKAEEKRQQEAQLPWETVKIINNSNGNIRDIIKEEILDLSTSEENFLTEESNYMFEFEFDMEECKYQAIKLMEYDQRLGLLRNSIVPSKVSDERFWKNYFYNVELIKMKHAIKAEEEAENHENGVQDEDDILKPDENEDEVLIKHGAKGKTSKADKKKQEAVSVSTEETSGTNEGETTSPDFKIKIGDSETTA